MKEKLTIKNMVLIAIFAAIECVLAPFSIPLTGLVPISLATLVLYFAVYILGAWRATFSCVIYLLLGLVGLPVFSSFSSGPAKLFGPTGGYLFGYILLVIISGIFIDKFSGKWYMALIGMLLGTAACYALGTAWLAYVAHYSFAVAMSAGVIPFIPGDLIKIALALLIAPVIKKALVRAHLI